jgi:ribosomal protein S18 acetylase RimI-like enzyme
MENSEDDSSNHCIDIVLRKAKTTDIDDIVNIYSNSINYLDIESREWIESIIKRRSRRARIYVADLKGRVAGFVIIYKKRDKAYIDAFAVDISYRGRGIGSCLLNYVENTMLSEGVERIYLTVKNHNNKALELYIRRGYRISSIVLVLETPIENIDIDNFEKISIRVDNIKRGSFPKIKLLDTAIWSNFTWDIDEAIYKVSNEEATTITVYIGRRIAGIAQISIEQNKVIVDRLATSYYRPSQSIKELIKAIKIYIDRNRLGKTITIPVDSTKSTLLKTLIAMGFKVIDSEYVLYKDLVESRDESKEKQIAVINNSRLRSITTSK